MTETDPTLVRSNIDSLLDRDPKSLVAAYYEEEGKFAGSLFDDLPNNDPAAFTAEDLVAVSLLDVRFEPRAVRTLSSSELHEKLARVGHGEMGTSEWEEGPGNDLYLALRELPGVGPTKTNKLIARKRPRSFPIIDSVVETALGLGTSGKWSALHRVLTDEKLRQRIDELAPAEVANRPSTLRLLDVAIWMAYSGSQNAIEVRTSVGWPS